MLNSVRPITTAPPRSSSCVSRLMTSCNEHWYKSLQLWYIHAHGQCTRGSTRRLTGMNQFQKNDANQRGLGSAEMNHLQFIYKQSADRSKAPLSACLTHVATLLVNEPAQEDICCSQHPRAGDRPPHTT